VLPSDHHIADEPGFRDVLTRALRAAETSPVATIGISPTRPETGYGYIETGEKLSDGVYRVARFVEKPDLARAETYLASGRHLWNSGMFFFRARAIGDLIRRHIPDLAEGLDRIDRAREAGREPEELARTFPVLPSISIDHGVL